MKNLLIDIFYKKRTMVLIIEWTEKNNILYIFLMALFFGVMSRSDYKGFLISAAASLPLSLSTIKINDINRRDVFIPAPPFHISVESLDEARFYRIINFLYWLGISLILMIKIWP